LIHAGVPGDSRSWVSSLTKAFLVLSGDVPPKIVNPWPHHPCRSNSVHVGLCKGPGRVELFSSFFFCLCLQFHSHSLPPLADCPVVCRGSAHSFPAADFFFMAYFSFSRLGESPTDASWSPVTLCRKVFGPDQNLGGILRSGHCPPLRRALLVGGRRNSFHGTMFFPRPFGLHPLRNFSFLLEGSQWFGSRPVFFNLVCLYFPHHVARCF